jgi:hypothetical protein
MSPVYRTAAKQASQDRLREIKHERPQNNLRRKIFLPFTPTPAKARAAAAVVPDREIPLKRFRRVPEIPERARQVSRMVQRVKLQESVKVQVQGMQSRERETARAKDAQRLRMVLEVPGALRAKLLPEKDFLNRV